MKFLFFIILTISLAKCETKTANTTMDFLQNDTLKYASDFKLVVDDILNKKEDTHALTTEGAISFVKVYNSVISFSLLEQEPYKTFYEKFNNVYMEDILKILSCNPSLGMGYYCDKYKLIIGGIKYPKNSYIVILELQK